MTNFLTQQGCFCRCRVILGRLLLLLSCLFFVGNGTNLYAGRNIALVVGVSDYDDRGGVSLLEYVNNDAVEIYNVFKNAGFKIYPLCEKKTGIKGAVSPTKANIERTLKRIVSSDYCSEDDVIVVYFSGHGKQGEKDKEKTLLFAKDSINGQDETCLSAQEIRIMLRDCPSRNTVLLIDSCHAGGTRSAASGNMRSFVEGGTEDVITIASCTVNQVSKKWSDKSMSFFTYWLREGLKGYADSDHNDTISTDELFEYIRENLERTEKVSPHGQWPVIVGSKDLQHFPLATPKPRDLFDTLDDIAEQVVTRLHLQKINTVQFCDFKPESELKSGSARRDNALKSITDYSSRELVRRLRAKSQNIGISVVTEPTQTGARLENFVLNESSEGDKKVFTFESTIKSPDNPEAESTIKAKVLTDKTGETITAPEEPSGSGEGETEESGVSTARPAPAQTSQREDVEFLPPAISIEVQTPGGEFVSRPIENIEGSHWVALDAGEVYRIVLETRTLKQEGLGLRLLVDGRNTLPQYMPHVPAKFVISEAAVTPETSTSTPANSSEGAGDNQSRPTRASEETSDAPRRDRGNPVAQPTDVPEVRPHVRLDQARFWILDAVGRYMFNGYYHDIETDSAYDEFLIAPTAEHLTPGEYNDQVGLITVAFYDLFRTRSPGTDMMTVPGKTRPFPIFVMDGLELGEQLSCFQLRYASSGALAAYKAELAGEGSAGSDDSVTR